MSVRLALRTTTLKMRYKVIWGLAREKASIIHGKWFEHVPSLFVCVCLAQSLHAP